MGSAAGHRLIAALAAAGTAYAAALLLGPAQSALSSVVKWRLIYRTQDRLMAAVGGPPGIGHLENPKVLDDLELAQGQLVNPRPADAPMTLAVVISNRASGLFALIREQARSTPVTPSRCGGPGISASWRASPRWRRSPGCSAWAAGWSSATRPSGCSR
jgi:hypothetical protein